MKQYKVAIIGNGMICNAAHIPAYQAMGDKVRIVAVADIREEAARETAERHGIPKYYVDPYKMLEEEKPDIILMDIRMPIMDGIQATEKIRTISLTVPIIAVTAYAFYTEQQQAIQAGCNAVISKPYSLERLKLSLIHI